MHSLVDILLLHEQHKLSKDDPKLLMEQVLRNSATKHLFSNDSATTVQALPLSPLVGIPTSHSKLQLPSVEGIPI